MFSEWRHLKYFYDQFYSQVVVMGCVAFLPIKCFPSWPCQYTLISRTHSCHCIKIVEILIFIPEFFLWREESLFRMLNTFECATITEGWKKLMKGIDFCPANWKSEKSELRFCPWVVETITLWDIYKNCQ